VKRAKKSRAGIAINGGRRGARNPAGVGWRAKGFRAGVSGRYSDSSDAWKAAAGKPPRQVPGGFGAPAESGKYITAHEYFLEGFNRGAEAREKKRGNAGRRAAGLNRKTRKSRSSAQASYHKQRHISRVNKKYANPAGPSSVAGILRERYGVGVLEAPPYALVWSYEHAAEKIGKKKAGAQLSSINRQRERAGKMPAYRNAGRLVPSRSGRGGRVRISRAVLQKYRYLFGGKIPAAALKLIKKEYGKIKNPGAGAFERCVKEVAARGQAASPRGVCATAGRKKYGAKKFAKMAAAGRRRAARKRSNPEEAAAERYEFFHGRAPGEVIDVTTKIHEHGVLSGIGKLQALVISAVDGSGEVTLSKFRGALLAQNEAGTQLFIEGGDQSVRISDFIGRRAAHETETLGPVLEVVYSTQKDHLRPEDGGKGNYHHKFGKRGTLLPLMIYDVVNKLLRFSGGGYDLPEVGIRG
jgi:hypothetical protein